MRHRWSMQRRLIDAQTDADKSAAVGATLTRTIATTDVTRCIGALHTPTNTHQRDANLNEMGFRHPRHIRWRYCLTFG